MDDDLICAVGSRGRGKGEFTNPQVSRSIRINVVILSIRMTILTVDLIN